MIIQDIIEKLESDFPLSKAESWDNCGLQVGTREKDIKKIYIALDPTEEVIDEAIAFGADLLLTHHPMTISGIKKVNTDSFETRKYYTAIRHDLCCYAMHTNYDVVVMGTKAADRLCMTEQCPLEVIGMDAEGKPEGIGRVGFLKSEETLKELSEKVKEAFGLDTVRVFGDLQRKIKKVAICPGSGKSLMKEVIASGSDVYITGDIGHHDGIDAVEKGICVIDAGHYGLEQIFIEQMMQYLKNLQNDLEIGDAKDKCPFQVF